MGGMQPVVLVATALSLAETKNSLPAAPTVSSPLQLPLPVMGEHNADHSGLPGSCRKASVFLTHALIALLKTEG